MGLVLENDKKLIQAVDGSAVRCSGSTAIKVEYQGQEAKIRALVTPSLKDEVILSKKTLQKLSVLPKGFPNVQVVQTRAVKAQVGENDDKEALSDKECSSNTSKASKTEGWNEDSELNDEVKKLKKKYETVFNTEGGLKPMLCNPYKIELKDNIPIKPIHVNVPRRTPYAFQGALVREGVLEYVEGSSEWVSPSRFVPKPDGDVRMVPDLVHLNKFVKRPIHPFKPPKDIIALVDPHAKYFATFDAKHGYWQVVLDPDSRHLTTIITEYGLYRFIRAPMGLTSSGDIFCQKTDEALAGIPELQKLVDNIMITVQEMPGQAHYIVQI